MNGNVLSRFSCCVYHYLKNIPDIKWWSKEIATVGFLELRKSYIFGDKGALDYKKLQDGYANLNLRATLGDVDGYSTKIFKIVGLLRTFLRSRTGVILCANVCIVWGVVGLCLNIACTILRFFVAFGSESSAAKLSRAGLARRRKSKSDRYKK